MRIRVQNGFRKTINTLKPKKNNKTITSEELIELEEASRYYYVLKKFNWLLASTNKKILDVNVERRFNHRLNRYLNYSEILAYMLAIDDELEEAFYLRNDVTYFYDHCTYDTAKKQLEKIINSFIIVDDKANRKMNTAIVENRNKSIKLLKHASNGYLNWERFRNRILYTLNEDTTFYYTSIRKDGK